MVASERDPKIAKVYSNLVKMEGNSHLVLRRAIALSKDISELEKSALP
jgi:hypothetical protein